MPLPRSRTVERIAARLERTRPVLLPVLRTAVAASLAWWVAKHVIGHQAPFFAPVVAIIVSGVAIGREARRAAEVVVGVALGIAVADVLVRWIGSGVLQLGVVCALAMLAAAVLDSGVLLASQAGVSAILVVTLAPTTGSAATTGRFVDALVGGGIALGLSHVLFPPNPVRMVTRAAAPLLDELAETLADVAAALREGSLEHAEAALRRARSIERLVGPLREAVDVGRETAQTTPGRRRARGRVEAYGETALQLARDAAALSMRALDDDPGLAGTAVVSSVQSAATDLLRGSGLTTEEARRAFYEAVDREASGSTRR